MQKHHFIFLFSFLLIFSVSEAALAAIISLPRYQGSIAHKYTDRTQSGGKDKVEITCASKGGVEKGANQTCTGLFMVGGLACYKSCSCPSSYQYTVASHQGTGKLCASLSNACTINDVTKYSVCNLNTCSARNTTWIGESSKTSYTSNNYACTSQNTSGKDGTCYVCACPSSWASGSCPANAASCSSCKAISPYTVNKFNLISCKAGYYKNGNACTQCPAGSYCDGTNKNTCPAGSYSAAGASSCTACPAGQNSAAGASSCASCAAGTYAAAGSSTCSKCSAGTYSAAGATSCSSCSAGKYSSAGASSCSTCAAGTYSGAGASSCTSCPAGKYSSAGASSCTSCSAGTYSSAGASSCSSCSGNTYSAAGASGCTSCPSGQTVNSSHTGCFNDVCAKYKAKPWVVGPDYSTYEANCKILDNGNNTIFAYGGKYYSSGSQQVCENTTYAECIDCETYVGPGAIFSACPSGYVKVKADGTVSRGMGYETLGCGFCSNDCAKAFSAATFVTGESSSNPGSFADNCQTKGMGYSPSEFYECRGETYAPCQDCNGLSWVTRGWYISSTTDLSDSAWNTECRNKYGYGAIKDEKISCGYKRYYSCKCDSGYSKTSTNCEPNIGNCSKSSTCSTLSFNNGYVSFTSTMISDFVNGANTTCDGIYKNGSYAGSCIYCEKDHRIYAKCNNSGIKDGFCANFDCSTTP